MNYRAPSPLRRVLGTDISEFRILFRAGKTRHLFSLIDCLKSPWVIIRHKGFTEPDLIFWLEGPIGDFRGTEEMTMKIREKVACMESKNAKRREAYKNSKADTTADPVSMS